MTDARQELLRAIPPVDEILRHEDVQRLRESAPAFPWTKLIRRTLDDLRALDRAPAGLRDPDRRAVADWVARELEARAKELRTGGLRRVLNGTGVVLHTNLGRAPQPDAAYEAVRDAVTGYVSLEVDAATGERSGRGEVLGELLELATGAEDCMVVNNNAAAVYLLCGAFSPPGRVIVSRGELVEIGGSFRLPEILRAAAHDVVEVGTTNRTYARDYEDAAGPDDLILKVHKSNYEIEGFAHEATVGELVEVARRVGCRVAYDLGSGAVFDYAAAGLGDDPPVAAILETGVDCVTMSGDKLLGGAQAGILLGNAETIAACRRNPLRRAVRVDKVTIAALQSVMRAYLFSADPTDAVPVLRHALAETNGLTARARRIAERLPAAATVVSDEAAVGGGSLSSVAVPSVAIAIACSDEKAAVALARRMRLHEPPLFPRIRGAEVRVNMMAIRESEDEELGDVLTDVLAGEGNR